MIRSAWRIWKRFRWKNLVRVWAVFMAIALVLLAQTLGIHYGATKFTLKYMARNEAIPAQNAIMGQRATNLMLVDSSQDGVDEAETMMKQVLLDMKVPTATVDLAKTDPDDIPSLNRYRTVLIVMPELDSLGDELVSIMRWVEGGGNMMLAMTPEKTGYLDAIGPQIGIESSAYDYVMTKGIKPARDFMLGGGHTYMFSGPFKSSLSLNLNEKAAVEAVSANGHTPLIWSADVRSGRTVTCNIGIYGKVVRGFYASAFSLLGSATAYPVINSAAFYLDDFPSPVPSGDATYIKRDYGMSITNFYSKVWWPDLTKLAERYGIRFNGVMIENYGDDTKDAPVRQKDESHFIYFGGLLLEKGGEIGIHEGVPFGGHQCRTDELTQGVADVVGQQRQRFGVVQLDNVPPLGLMVEVGAGQVLHLKQPPGPAPCPAGSVELQGASYPVVGACAGCDGLILGVAGLAQLLPELQHPAHIAGQVACQCLAHILFGQPRQLYASVVEPAEELGAAAGVCQPCQGFALCGLLLGDQSRAGKGALHQFHVHGHAPGVHLHILPPLLHDLLRHRPGGQLAVVGPLSDHIHAVVFAEKLPLGSVVVGQVAGAPAVDLGWLAGRAEVFDKGLALLHLKGVLRLLQGRTEGTQLSGQAAVQCVHHAALPLLEPEHPLLPAQAHGLRKAPPLEGGIVRPLGVAVIQQPRHTHIKAAPWVRFQRQVKHCRCS